MRSATFATPPEPFITHGTFSKVRNFSVIGPMQTSGTAIFSRKDRGIAATAALVLLLACSFCHATYAQQSSTDQTQKTPDGTEKAPPPPPEAQPKGDPKTGMVKPPDVDPKMAKKVPDVDPGMTQPPADKQQPAADGPPKVQPK